MPRRIETDDEVRRFSAVWLGPPGYGFPFHARYTAYGVFAAVFAVILLVEALTPLAMRIPPIWEVCIALLVTMFVMSAVDHDKPVGAVLRNAWSSIQRPVPRDVEHARAPRTRRVKITREPL